MDPLELHSRTLDLWHRRVELTPLDRWDAPTPCIDWDVRDLVNHVVAEERWAVPLLEGATLEEVGDRFDGDLLGEQPVAAAAEAVHEVQWAFAAADVAARTVHLSFGDVPAVEYALGLAADHLIHAWDMAAATGGETRLPRDLVVAVAGWYATTEDAYRDSGMVGPPPRLPADAGPQERLLAAFGRPADWNPTVGVVDRFNAAFESHDVDRIMACSTEDTVFESTSPPPDGQRYEGAAAVRAVWEKLFADAPDARFEAEERFACGDRAVVRWRYTWGGGSGHVRGVDVMRLRDGKVAEKLSYVKG
jgi:uncharacterized protein (TIGR03086 family)